MEQKWMDSMKDSISEVLGTMFYSPVEFEKNKKIEDINSFFSRSDVVICRINVSGGIDIAVFTGIEETTLREMAMDFTGKFELTEEDSHGTFKEMMNMICGGALADSYGDSEFKLGIPEIVSEDLYKKSVESEGKEAAVLKGNLLNGEIAFITM